MGDKLWVIKASGEREPFNDRKLKNTLLRAGANSKLASEIVVSIRNKAHDGVRTKEILKMALSMLNRSKHDDAPLVAMKYGLKSAIMSLGPSGFPFEKFVAELLRHYGYDTVVGKTFQGFRVDHEVDVSALEISNKKRLMIECKYHNQPGIHTDVKVAMYTYARFLDLKKYFDAPWLFSNTKVTEAATSYAKGVGLMITTWNYPSGASIQELIEKKGLYPITILPEVRGLVKEKLADAGIIITKNLHELSVSDLVVKTGLSSRLLSKLKSDAERLVA